MPIVTIQSPTGQSFQIDAPEGATDEQIFMFAKSQGLFKPQDAPIQQSAGNIYVPASGAEPFPAQPTQPERTIGETALGLGEAALTTATGATGGAIGFLAGAVPGVIGEAT